VILCDAIPEFSRTEEPIQSAVRCPSDLTDEEGEILEPIINELESYTIGRPRKSDLRELLNASFYLDKTGYPWRYLPKDFPPYKLVNYYYSISGQIIICQRKPIRCFVSGYAKKRPKARFNGSNY